MSDAALVSIVGILVAGTVTLGVVAMVYRRSLSFGVGKRITMKVAGRQQFPQLAAREGDDTKPVPAALEP